MFLKKVIRVVLLVLRCYNLLYLIRLLKILWFFICGWLYIMCIWGLLVFSLVFFIKLCRWDMLGYCIKFIGLVLLFDRKVGLRLIGNLVCVWFYLNIIFMLLLLIFWKLIVNDLCMFGIVFVFIGIVIIFCVILWLVELLMKCLVDILMI